MSDPDVSPIVDKNPTDSGTEARVPSFSAFNLIWPILLSLLVLGVIGYWNYEPGSFREVGRVLNPWILMAAPGVLILRVLIGGVRLRYVSHGNLSFRDGIRGQLLWDFSSNVTPSTIGGAPFAALFIARDAGLPVGRITAVMLFAMLLDQIWFLIAIPSLLVASLFLDLYPASIGRIGSTLFTTYFLGVLVWTSLFAYATLVRPQVIEGLITRLFRLKFLRRFEDRVRLELQHLRERAEHIRSQRFRFFVGGVLFSGAVWMCRYLSLLFVIWSVAPAVSKLTVLFRTIAMTLGALILPTPGGSGGLEGMYALFFNPLIPHSFVAPTLLTWRLFAYYLPTAIGVALSTQVVRRAIRAKRLAQT